MKNKQVTKNFIWNTLGLTFNAFNSLFFLIIAKLVNGLDIAGVFTYAFSLCTLFYVLSTYYNRAFQVSTPDSKFNFNDFLSARIVLSILTFILIAIFSIISSFDTFKIGVILLIMGFRIVESISDCFYGALQQKDRLDQAGISLTVKAISGVLTFLVIDLLTHNLIFSLVALIFINIFWFLIYDFKNYHRLHLPPIHFSTKNLKFILKTCFPVFIFSALSIYLANCQKYVLTYYTSNDLQTIFGILIMPATMLSLVGNYLIVPFINNFTKHHTEHNYKQFAKSALSILLILAAIGVLALVFCYFLGIPVLNLLYAIDLSDYQTSLLIIILASVFLAMSTVLSNLLTILGKNTIQTILYLIAALVGTGFSILFATSTTPVQGSTIAFLISTAALFALFILSFVSNLKKLSKGAQ